MNGLIAGRKRGAHRQIPRISAGCRTCSWKHRHPGSKLAGDVSIDARRRHDQVQPQVLPCRRGHQLHQQGGDSGYHYNRFFRLLQVAHQPLLQVFWTSPPRGSGCIDFKLMVVERQDVWYMDDGALTYKMCEDDSPLAEPTVSYNLNHWKLDICLNVL